MQQRSSFGIIHTMNGRFVAYYRVSTTKQGQSGLGLEGQREAVRAYLNGGRWSLIGEFTEVESGRNNDRPELAKALAHCRLTGATLVVGKLDRLARNARFLLATVDGSGDGGVVFCDLPTIPVGPVGRFLITQMAAVAELEAGLISTRTKAALAAAKAKGVKLGGWKGGPPRSIEAAAKGLIAKADTFAAGVGPMVADMHGRGLSLRQIAAELASKGVMTARGGAWTAAAVKAVLDRLRGAAGAAA
jgi:DNA invertase Pin-like site-specific DNA recombinase